MSPSLFRRLAAVTLAGFAALLLGLGFNPDSAALAQGHAVYSMRVLHTNDTHARIEPVVDNNREFGGVARRYTMIERFRQQDPNLLLLDAGDVFQGTLYFTEFEGMADAWFMNAMRYDAMAVGNHEFDRGDAALARFIQGTTFPSISANLDVSGSPDLAGKIRPWIIIENKGERIGIFGLTAEDTPVLSSPSRGVRFLPSIPAAQRAVDELKAQGVNKIIGLTHIGITEDIRVAQAVNDIDIIIGGHSHTPMGRIPAAQYAYPHVVQNPAGENVYITQVWEWGRWLGDFTADFDANGKVVRFAGAQHVVDDTIERNAAMQAKVNEFAAPLAALRRQVIGSTTVELDGDRTRIRAQETNLGNLLADAMLDRTRSAGAQIAITNAGGIRTSIPAGQVTFGQVLEVLPFGNTVALTSISGTQVREALENGVSQVESGGGRFPQVAGLRFAWDPSAPVGSRVTAIQVRSGNQWVPINPAGSYRVATNNFMLAGGDGYAAFTRGTNQVDTGLNLDETLAEAIAGVGSISIGTDGRIVRGTSLPAN